MQRHVIEARTALRLYENFQIQNPYEQIPKELHKIIDEATDVMVMEIKSFLKNKQSQGIKFKRDDFDHIFNYILDEFGLYSHGDRKMVDDVLKVFLVEYGVEG